MSRSLAGSLLTLFAGLLLFAAGVAAAMVHLGQGPMATFLLVLLVGLVGGAWLIDRWLAPVRGLLLALRDALASFRDGDFSVRLDERRRDELGELARLHNATGDVLREERTQVRQRELLLATALDESPVAILLINPLDRILYANREARQLLVGGQPLQGSSFTALVARCPPQMRELLAARQEGVFTVDGGSARSAGEVATVDPAPAADRAPAADPTAAAHAATAAGTGGESAAAAAPIHPGDDALPDRQRDTYHLLVRAFLLNRRPHRLVLLRRITPELSRQEAEIWKRVIRVLSHELNNSLAPISSLIHSAELLLRRGDQLHRLGEIFPTLRERIAHLSSFLEGYAHFARLPRPQLQPVDWDRFLADTAQLLPFTREGDPPSGPGWFDPAQLQQVLINLLKNALEASESGEEPPAGTTVRVVDAPDGGHLLQVLDRGRGMSEEELTHALLPFYSTKREGGGLGLALCREIVEAHGGRIALQARPGGGTVVSCWIPARRESFRPPPGSHPTTAA